MYQYMDGLSDLFDAKTPSGQPTPGTAQDGTAQQNTQSSTQKTSAFTFGGQQSSTATPVQAAVQQIEQQESLTTNNGGLGDMVFDTPVQEVASVQVAPVQEIAQQMESTTNSGGLGDMVFDTPVQEVASVQVAPVQVAPVQEAPVQEAVQQIEQQESLTTNSGGLGDMVFDTPVQEVAQVQEAPVQVAVQQIEQQESPTQAAVQQGEQSSVQSVFSEPKKAEAVHVVIQKPEDMPSLNQSGIVEKVQTVVVQSPSQESIGSSQPTLESITKVAAINTQNAQRIPSTQKTIRKGTNINMSAFLWGCGLFLLLITGIGALVLYHFTSNPEIVNGIIDTETIKSLLKVFATVFFGFLFFAGFSFVVLNTHRLVTLKNVPKFGYGVGLFLGIILLFGSLIAGKISLDNIVNIATQQHYVSNNLLLVGVPLKSGVFQLDTTPGLKLIAPTNLFFRLNPTIFERTIINTIGNDILEGISLDCGNGQILNVAPGTLDFPGSCLFLKKDSYVLTLKLQHTDRQSGAPKSKDITLPLQFDSEIMLSTSIGPVSINESKSEILMGKAPQRIFMDASKVFTDMQIGEYKISRDTDADDTFDIADNAAVSAIYREPQLQTVYYTIPALGEFVYSLVFRVEQSDVPICEIGFDAIKDATYNIMANCTAQNGPVSRYNFSIIDEENRSREVDSITSSKSQIKYDFPGKGNFRILLNFITAEGRKGYAESDVLEIGNLDFSVNYDLTFRGGSDNQWNNFAQSTEHTFDRETRTIVLQRIPMFLRLKINGITPVLRGTEVAVFLDEEPVFSRSDDEFEIPITQDKAQSINIVITNEEAGAETVMSMPILIQQARIIPNLIAIPDSVGASPFEVTLDASATEVTDPDDRLIYFSWDFGDGEVQRNSSTSIMKHTYRYNDDLDNGMYNPKVTVTTKNGLTRTIPLEQPIIVQKPIQKSRISVDSHPSQAAKIGEEVTFSIRTDGIVSRIIWDLDDGTVLELPGRGATEVKHSFQKEGRYRVSADILYDNQTTARPSITVLID